MRGCWRTHRFNVVDVLNARRVSQLPEHVDVTVCAGPIAVVRDPNKLVAVRGSARALNDVKLFSAAGVKVCPRARVLHCMLMCACADVDGSNRHDAC